MLFDEAFTPPLQHFTIDIEFLQMRKWSRTCLSLLSFMLFSLTDTLELKKIHPNK